MSHVCSPQNVICSSVKSFGQCQLKVLTLGTADLMLLVLVPRMQSCSAVLFWVLSSGQGDRQLSN